jgi:uncharacterized protein YndB with AHSA1/START domain
MAKDIRFEAVYPFPPEQVWAALTDPVALGEWLMPNDFAPVVGHRFQFRTKPAPGFDGVVHCQVLELDPPKRLSFSWAGGGIDTKVAFELTPLGSSTRLLMTQTGFKGLRGMMVSNILKGGWKRMIELRLRAAAGRVVGGVYRPDPASPDARCHKDVK